MFNEITSQVSSWIWEGRAKDGKEEKILTLEESNNDERKEESDEFKIFANLKNRVEDFSDWIGLGISKLNIENKEQFHVETGKSDEFMNETITSENDDNQLRNLQNDLAKSISNFFSSAIDKAGKTVSEASSLIKESIENSNILVEFNREQTAFVKNQIEHSSAQLPPWVGCLNENILKDECLNLSLDKRNFVRSPPEGIDFQFDYNVSFPIAIAIMEEDPKLIKIRYELVPKVISEENFWRNYFYRLSLICQANELLALENTYQDLETPAVPENEVNILQINSNVETKQITTDIYDKDWETDLEIELFDYETINRQNNYDLNNDDLEHEVEDML